jgi:putative endonuclease
MLNAVKHLKTMKSFYVYIMTNKMHTVLYTGVTSDIIRRNFEHKNKLVKGFTEKYNVNKLIYFEHIGTALEAIAREKQIKGWLRQKKIDLINSVNPEWKDLADQF